MTGDASASADLQPPGVVELREDVPLKAGGSAWRGAGAGCARGPRLIMAAFAALTAAITLALLTQIYYGDYEVVPHGAASSSVAACSRAGTDALKAGGRALDAAAAAALCLAVAAPHRTSLDASGSMLYWEYRQSHSQQPLLVEWGGPVPPAPGPRPPRLVAALAALHAQLGVLPWPSLLQPAIQLARDGFPVSEGLAAVEGVSGGGAGAGAGALRTAPALADYLETLQHNTSAELTAAWGGAALLRQGAAPAVAAGGVRAWAGGPGATTALAALTAALQPPPADPDQAFLRVVDALQEAAEAEAKAEAKPGAGAGAWPAAGVASGLAVVDRLDTYLALVTGLSMPFGNGAAEGAGAGAGVGWVRDEPSAPLDLAPALLADDALCGTRYVVGAESSGALAQAAAALAAGGGAAGVERARVQLTRGGALALELARAAPLAPLPARAATINASLPYPAVNVVQQRADALLSHADSRGGGLASRF